MSPQYLSIEWRTSTSWAQRLLQMATGSGPMSRSKESARLWAVSVLMTSVFRPASAQRSAVAAEMLVLPVPPLPVWTMMRMA